MNTGGPIIGTLIVLDSDQFEELGELPAAIASARQLGPVYVACTPAAREVAAGRAGGAQLLVPDAAGVSDLRNWALRQVPAGWVLVLAPDERVTPILASEVRAAARAAGDACAGFWIPIRLLFMGRIVRHGGLSGLAAVRLVRPVRAAFDARRAHRSLRCDGHLGTLRAPLLRLRIGNIGRIIERLINEADGESDDWLTQAATTLKRHNDNPTAARRAALRRIGLAGPVPGRAIWRLMSMFVLRLGFLDGRAGWHLARLAAGYEYIARLMFEDKLRHINPTQ